MDCKTNHIELENQFAAILRKAGPLIGPAVIVVGANTHTENAMICRKTSHLGIDQLFKLCFGVDSCNKPALRIKFINTCTSLIDCKNGVDAQPLRRMFAYDSDAKTFALVLNQST